MSRLPLCTRDEVQAELDDTLDKLDRLYDSRPVSEDHGKRRDEARANYLRWKRDLTEQLAEMDAAA